MIDIQTALTYLTLISVPVGVFYHIMTLQNTRKNQEITLKAQQLQLETRQAQLFTQLYNEFKKKDFLKLTLDIQQWEFEGWDEFLSKYGAMTSPELYSSFYSVGAFYEGIGVLVKRNLIDIELVDDMISGPILNFWNKFGEAIKEGQKINPNVFEYTEYLAKEIEKVYVSEHGRSYDSTYYRDKRNMSTRNR
jgi:hypothetical protein